MQFPHKQEAHIYTLTHRAHITWPAIQPHQFDEHKAPRQLYIHLRFNVHAVAARADFALWESRYKRKLLLALVYTRSYICCAALSPPLRVSARVCIGYFPSRPCALWAKVTGAWKCCAKRCRGVWNMYVHICATKGALIHSIGQQCWSDVTGKVDARTFRHCASSIETIK